MLDARILNGPYLGNRTGDFPADTSRNFGFGARRDSLAGMPHFATNTFEGRFPVAKLSFASPEFPGAVGLTAFNPSSRSTTATSSIPVAMFEIEFTNPTDAPITYTAVGVVGHGLHPPTKASRVKRKGATGVKVDDRRARYRRARTMPRSCLRPTVPSISRQTHLYRGHWFDALEVYWKDLHRPGPFTDRDYGTSDLAGGMGRNRDSSLARRPRHRRAGRDPERPLRAHLVHTELPQILDHADLALPSAIGGRRASGRTGTRPNGPAPRPSPPKSCRAGASSATTPSQFRDAVYSSTLPVPVLDAAAANLSILKSPTTLRLEDGTFYGWEGCHPAAGSCEGSCTHVWNYQQALPFLYPGARALDARGRLQVQHERRPAA